MKKIITPMFGLMLSIAFAIGFNVSASASELNLCTGSKSGKYFAKGEELANLVKRHGVTVNVIPTGGSYDNLDLIKDGTCDAAMVQPNVWAMEGRKGGKIATLANAGSLYKEYVHVICNRDSDIEDSDDLEDGGKDITIAVGADGSGNAATWQDFVDNDSDYGDLNIKYIGNQPMLNAILNNTVQCGIVVSGKNSDLLMRADSRGDMLRLIDMDDGDFNDAKTPDGKKLYEFVEMTSDDYPGLIGWSDLETVAMYAMVVVDPLWIAENQSDYEEILSVAIFDLVE